MTISQAAKQLNVSQGGLISWETDEKFPRVPRLKEVVSFIGYLPWKVAGLTFGEQLTLARKLSGLSIEKFCSKHDFDASNISRIELGKQEPFKSTKTKLTEFIESVFFQFPPIPSTLVTCHAEHEKR